MDFRLVVLVVIHGGNQRARNSNKTVVISLLEVHVDNTTGPCVGHLARVDRADLLELSWLHLVTTVFREENWNAQVLVVLGEVLVARIFPGRRTAPRVHVDTEKVCSFVLRATGKVVSKLHSDGNVVVGRVTHGDRSVVLLLEVGLSVSNGGLHVSRSNGVVGLVGNLVTGKETQDVGVVVESVHDGGVSLQQLGVPRRAVSVDGVLWLGQVGNDIDTGIVQRLHTLGVVLGGVQGVHSDDVGVQVLQVRNVSLTSVWVGQWVDVTIGGSEVDSVLLVGNASHQELGAIIGEVELVAYNFDLRQGGRGRAKGHCGGEQRAKEHSE